MDDIKKDINAYKKLSSINKSKEFDEFFELLLKTVSQKMIHAFTSDKIKTFDDFLLLKGEIISYLYPIQEVKSADAMAKHLEEQLNQYYKVDNQ